MALKRIKNIQHHALNVMALSMAAAFSVATCSYTFTKKHSPLNHHQGPKSWRYCVWWYLYPAQLSWELLWHFETFSLIFSILKIGEHASSDMVVGETGLQWSP